MFILIRAIWRISLKLGRYFGLSDSQASQLSRQATQLWARLDKPGMTFYRLAQRFMARRIGIFMSTSVESSELLGLIRRLTPVASPFNLIRVGGDGDGGYLVPNDLKGINVCFSPEVAESSGFELGLAAFQIHSFLIDYSVEAPPVDSKFLHFEKLFLSSRSDWEKFVRLEDWVSQKAPSDEDLILQMDIEGSEWSVLADVSDVTLRKFRIIAIEFHCLEEMLTSPLGAEMLSTVLDKLERNFRIVHIHPNNTGGSSRYKGEVIPNVLEVTFLRSDRFSLSETRHRPSLPHPLDQRNDLDRKDISLSSAWRNFPSPS